MCDTAGCPGEDGQQQHQQQQQQLFSAVGVDRRGVTTTNNMLTHTPPCRYEEPSTGER
jgi:hypothetical protein